MGRAETATLLPLDRYAEIMQIPPTHFNQLDGSKAPLAKGCDHLWDQTARESLAWTMSQAEEMVTEELDYPPSRKFIIQEQIDFGLTGVQSGRFNRRTARQDWRNAEITTQFGHVECFGAEMLTLKQADAGVEYLDLDNDPLEREETARIGTAIYADLPACANACEVAVFFRVSDGAKDAADPRWEIRPIKVDIDGDSMRIEAESSLFVRPNLWDLTEAKCFGSPEPDAWELNFELANLVPAVDVYCRTVNQATPVTLRWDGVCDCVGSCQHSTQTACAYVTDNKRGFFAPRPATWNGATNIEATPLHSVPPESVRVNYRAGLAIDSRTCRMNPNLERAIVKLTNSLLPAPPCGFCDAAEILWKQDRTNIDPLTPEAASLPWDLYTQGALEAWRIVKKMARGRGGKLGY